MFEDRKFFWVTKHKTWIIHTDAECKGVEYKRGGSGGNNNTTLPQALVMVTALAGSSRSPAPSSGPVVKVNESYQPLVQYCEDIDDESE
jgi:hypothetical protein